MLCPLLLALLAPPADPDRAALAAAGLDPDRTADVLGYLQKRTLGPADLSRLTAALARLGADRFADREAASREVIGFGPAAVGLLRTAVQQHPDPEVQHRASECLREVDRVPHARVAAAAVRAVVRLEPPAGPATLLGFLPLADSPAVADAVRAGLGKLAYAGGRPDPAVLAGLTSPTPACRAAAAGALVGRSDPPAEAVRAVAAAAAAEADPGVRFEMLFPLAAAARHRPAVAPLLDLLPKVPRGRQWQVEDLLAQAAGGRGPAVPFGKYAPPDDSSLVAWRNWWLGADGLDWAGVPFNPRTTGGLMLVSDALGPAGGLVTEVGPDLAERWRLPPTAMLSDVRPAAGGLVHVGDRTGRGYRVRLFDPLAGTVVAAREFAAAAPNQLDAPVAQSQPLPGGGVLLVSQAEVTEYPPASDTPVFRYRRPAKLDIATACRLPDGRTLVLLRGESAGGLFLDKAGIELPGPPVSMGETSGGSGVQAVPAGADRVLVAEPGRLAEIDTATGKAVWQRAVGRGPTARMPYGVSRLANGNLLYVESAGGTGQVVELTPAGEEVWRHAPAVGGFTLHRAYQR